MLYTTFGLTEVTRNKRISCGHKADGIIIVLVYCLHFKTFSTWFVLTKKLIAYRIYNNEFILNFEFQEFQIKEKNQTFSFIYFNFNFNLISLSFKFIIIEMIDSTTFVIYTTWLSY